MKSYRKSCEICESGEALCELFHRETSLSKDTGVRFSSHIARAFDDECFVGANKEKREPSLKRKKGEILLDAGKIEEDLFSVIIKRESTRNFADREVDFKVFSSILRYSYGKSVEGKYTAPSAGGNYPIRLIIVVKKVEGLQPGFYEYLHENSSLVLLYRSEVDYRKITQSLTLVENVAFSIHFIGSLKLVCYKYQDRGYRFMNIECGHIAQNILLTSEALNIGAVCSGGFLDGEFIKEMEELTMLDLSDYVELYEIFLGSKN